jgi:hypothetical protein
MHGGRPARRQGLMDYWKEVHKAVNAACAREGMSGWKTWRDVRRFVIRRERAFYRAEQSLEADMRPYEEELQRRGVRFVRQEGERPASRSRSSVTCP